MIANDTGGNDHAFETVLVCFADPKTATIKSLKVIVMQLKLSSMGTTKRVLFNCIHDSGHPDIEKLGDNEFMQHRMIMKNKKKESCVILTPEVLPSIVGINIETGAQNGFYGPTNKENAVGATRCNFLTKEKIICPCFFKKRDQRR